MAVRDSAPSGWTIFTASVFKCYFVCSTGTTIVHAKSALRGPAPRRPGLQSSPPAPRRRGARGQLCNGVGTVAAGAAGPMAGLGARTGDAQRAIARLQVRQGHHSREQVRQFERAWVLHYLRPATTVRFALLERAVAPAPRTRKARVGWGAATTTEAAAEHVTGRWRCKFVELPSANCTEALNAAIGDNVHS